MVTATPTAAPGPSTQARLPNGVVLDLQCDDLQQLGKLVEALKVYLHRAPIDFRAVIDGLALLVEQALGLDPFAATADVFGNRRRDRVKILLWDRNGYWLLMKRLEQDRFTWSDEATVATLTTEQLHWLLEGIDIGVVRRHPPRLYARVG